ncbi:hypothetical protein B0H67DRAFT_444058, partial [Lasiosphaeris hirsuta]
MQAAAASSVGARVLGEIEEASLDEVSTATAATTTTPATAPNDPDSAIPPPTAALPQTFPIPRLHDLVTRHFRATHSAPLAITGRHLALLHTLIATLLAAPHRHTVALVDFTARFDPLRLLTSGHPALTRADLAHLHIARPARGPPAHTARCVAAMEDHMLYAPHASRARPWWGTVVVGGGLNPAAELPGAAATAAPGGRVAVTADWKGWLRVDRAEVPAFWDLGVEEALRDREGRQRAVEEAGWVGVSAWG